MRHSVHMRIESRGKVIDIRLIDTMPGPLVNDCQQTTLSERSKASKVLA